MSVNIKQNGSLTQIAAYLPNNLITISSLPDTNIVGVQSGQSLYYDGDLNKWVNYSAKIILTYDDYFQGKTITCTQGQTVISKTAHLSENTLVFYVNAIGTWVIANGDFSVNAIVSAVGDMVSVELQSVPQGSTVTPTDDIQTWLKCANIKDKSYTTLAEVLADRSTFETLIADSNACDYMARSTTWADAEGTIPTMTDNTHPSGVASGTDYVTGYDYYKAFDDNDSTAWWSASTSSASANKRLIYEFPTAKVINRAFVKTLIDGNGAHIKNFKIEGSNNGTDWTTLTSGTYTSSDTSGISAIFENNTAYTYYSILVQDFYGGNYAIVQTLQFYNYNEYITTNPDAMALIGKYDYCSNALLRNSTWASAIATSDYRDYIVLDDPLVPIMTSAVASDGGKVTTSTNLSPYSNVWNAFNGSYELTTNQMLTFTATSGMYMDYEFPRPTICKTFGLANRWDQANGQAANAYAILGTNDNGVNWDTLASGNFTKPTSQSWQYVSLNVTKAYKIYRLQINSNYGYSGYTTIIEAQYYGRSSKTVYKELIPTMTSNTTPSGVASGSSINSDNYDFWHAFAPTDLRGWLASVTAPYLFANDYVSYEFPSAVVVDKAKFLFKYYSTANTVSGIFQAYDGSDWINISDIFSFTSSSNDAYADIPLYTQGVAYSKYRWICTTQPSNGNSYGVKFQLVTKTVQTNIVHSCANDTIYYLNNGSPIIVATTNSDGDGILDFSSLDEGVYTFYSSVAKNPNDLTLDFCKRIRVTNTQYGETTEAYLLPDTVDTLYWYGYEPVAMGATAHTNTDLNRTAPTLTNYTNYKSIYQPNGSRGNGYYAKSREANYLHLTLSGSTSITNQYNSAYLGMNNVNTNVSGTDDVNYFNVYPRNTASIPITNTKHSIVNNDYIVLQVTANSGNVTLNQYAMWYDRVSSDIPTFRSAPNDMLYILDGATKVYIANTNGEGKSYEPLLSAGTYTIYSSIAKDPNNLSNPYSKTITVDESTQTIAVMPENTLYWYGYMGDELEIISTANGWTHTNYTFTNPTFNVNSARFSSSSGVECGIGTKSTINTTKAYMVATGITIASTQYGFMGLISAKNTGSVGTPTYIDSTSQKLYSFTGDGTSKYLYNATANARVFDLFALWYE